MSEQNVDSVNPPKVSDSPEKKDVSYETYLKVLAEAKKAKEKTKLLEDAEAARKEADLKSQNQWETLAKDYQTKLEAEKAEKERLKDAINNGLKINKFEEALGGKIKNQAYYTHIPFDKIIIDAETGKVNEDSVKLAVSGYMKEFADTVSFPQGKMPNVASQGANVQEKNINNMTSPELQEYMRKLAASGEL